MPIEIKSYTEDLIPSVKAFNQRFKAAGGAHQFPEHHVPAWLPRLDGQKIFQEYFLAVENGHEVRGAFIIKHQEFSLGRETVSLGCYSLPISEGFVNKAYAATGLQLCLNALKRQPLLFGLGFGSRQVPLAVMLQKLGWTFETVPFFFLVQHPFRFLRNITYLRSTMLKRTLADLLAFSGAGWLGFKIRNLLWPKKPAKAPPQAEVVENFGEWVDAVWDTCKHDYTLCAVRDYSALNILYPRTDRRFIRLKVIQEGKPIGWAVLLNTQMNGSEYFGNMRLGSLIDCLALRKDAGQVVRAATQHLKASGADLIVSNQLDAAWGAALKDCGFMSGPSNLLFAASKKLAERLQVFPLQSRAIHMTRGDGEGPSRL